MDFTTMSVDALLEKRGAILTACEAAGKATDDELAEVRAINAELEKRKGDAAKLAELRKAAAQQGTGTVIAAQEQAKPAKGIDEVRNSKAYIDAFAEYIKSGDATECRKLITENIQSPTAGTVAVPAIVDDIVRHAWESDEILNRVKKTYFKGNLKVQFEISATGAVKHTEGGDAVNEQTLVLGIKSLVPVSVKKWVSISDEAIDLRGEPFIRYIYEELTHHIAKKIADEVVAEIIAAPAASTTTAVGVPLITASGVSVGLVAEALGALSDEAVNPVVMMNKATWAAFKAAQYAGNYNVDPFEGLPVLFNNNITAVNSATTGVTFAIVGDLGNGAQVNLPNGEGIEIKMDDKTDMTKDLVRFLGREYAAIGVVGPGQFVKITMAAPAVGG